MRKNNYSKLFSIKTFQIFFFGIFLLTTSTSFANGYNPSELNDVISSFEDIYLVKIYDILKERVKTKNNGVATHLTATIDIKEVLKGKRPKTTRVKYILPPCQFQTPEGMEMGVWLTIKGSGKELSVQENGHYILFLDNIKPDEKDGTIRFIRIEETKVKDRVLKLLAQ